MATTLLIKTLEELGARAKRLEEDIDNETDTATELAKRAELTALRIQIAASLNRITEMQASKGNFLFLRVIYCIFSLNFYFSFLPSTRSSKY